MKFISYYQSPIMNLITKLEDSKSDIIEFLEYVKTINPTKTYDYKNLDSVDLRFIFLYACSHGRLDVCKTVYQLSLDSNCPIDIKVCNSVTFRHSFTTGYLWITDWLYTQSKINNDPFDLEKWFEESVSKALEKEHYHHIVWLFEVFKKDNLVIKEDTVKKFIDKAVMSREKDKLFFWTDICKTYKLRIDIATITKSCDGYESYFS